METRRSFCRICTAYCGITAEVENGRLLAVRGDPADAADPRVVGASTEALISVERHYDAICGQPRMSAIPVRLSPRGS